MNSQKDQKVFALEIKVDPEDIDELGHVNNVVYLRYVQDAAQAHWLNVATESLQDQYFWIVLRHEINYHKPAFSGEIIEARTWVSSFLGAKSERCVDIFLNDILLSSAKTLWCLMDRKTKKPTRITDEIIKVFS